MHVNLVTILIQKVQKFCANTSEDQERSITAKLMLSSQENEVRNLKS